MIQTFGGADSSEAAIVTNGLRHYQGGGHAEGRPLSSFNVNAYLANYSDLREAFADAEGTYDEEAATVHFIRFGFFEGRTDDWQS